MEMFTNVADNAIKKAAKALKDGNLVAFPTETVYGLGADATNKTAVERIYSVKGRPANHPLIVHISSVNQINKWAIDIPDYALKLAKDFWPGPMTLILKRNELAKNFITGGQDNVGLRVPGHAIALELLSELEAIGGFGIAAPSANRYGAVSATTASAVAKELKEFLSLEDLVIDGGLCEIGLESTIIDCTNIIPTVLRPGALTLKEIGYSINTKIFAATNTSSIKVSGLLKAHYAPKAKVELNTELKTGDGFFAMANIPTPKGGLRLSSPMTTEEFARDLYEVLRYGDELELNKIIVIPPEGSGLEEAIYDRLNRASAK
jgi:L-threonylcarbamoyladenylate synthase